MASTSSANLNSSSREGIRVESFQVNTEQPKKQSTLIRFAKFAWKAFKYTYSCALLGLTLGVCFYGIGVGASNFFTTVPIWLDYILFIIFIAYLGLLEGAMISLSQLRRAPVETYAKTHKAAYRNAELAFRPDYLEKFLMGRQANVIVLVFMLSRLLSDNYLPNVAPWIVSGFLQTGLFGSFIVLILGNLVPQVTAAKFPVQFLNNPVIYVALNWCLFIRWIGLPHACWLCAKTIAFCLGLSWNADTVKSDASNDSALLDTNRKVDQFEEYFGVHPLSTDANKFQIPQNVRSLMVARPEEVDTRWTSRERLIEIFTANNIPVPTYLLSTTNANYVPSHIVACELVAENQRLLKQIHAANINLELQSVKNITSPITEALQLVVDEAALERLKLAQN